MNIDSVRKILIVSHADDLHAEVIAHELNKRPGYWCGIFEFDKMSGGNSTAFFASSAETESASVTTSRGDEICINNVDAIWWRRVNRRQVNNVGLPDHVSKLIENDCSATFRGIFLACFRGKWANHPVSTQNAENKLLQLKAARNCGLQIPNTLVTQDPVKVKNFISQNKYTIVKSVKGISEQNLLTTFLTVADINDEAIMMAPAIYQRFVTGNTHLRIQCFGNYISAVRLQSDKMDWRDDLVIPATEVAMSEQIKIKLKKVMNILGLSMGVIDLKIDDHGNHVWLEVNPQGQFLFLEPLAKVEYTKHFSDFLCSLASGAPVDEVENLIFG